MNQMNLSMKQKQAHRHREQTLVIKGGGMGWEFGISRWKGYYIGWINSQVLLFSTGKYVQHPVINHNGKEYEKQIYIYIYVYIYTYMTESLLYHKNKSAIQSSNRI